MVYLMYEHLHHTVTGLKRKPLQVLYDCDMFSSAKSEFVLKIYLTELSLKLLLKFSVFTLFGTVTVKRVFVSKLLSNILCYYYFRFRAKKSNVLVL